MIAPKVAIIGGGITGLAAAYHLQEISRAQGQKLEIHLFEAQPRLGGVIATVEQEGFLIEEGPDAFLFTKPWAYQLCQKLGLENQLISTQEKFRQTFVLHQGTLKPLPEGFFMLAPTKFLPFLASPLFSWKGKVRALLELFLPPKRSDEDESLADFVRRRFGEEIFQYIAQPLISAISTAQPEKLSMKAALFPFWEMEKKEGSLIKGMKKAQKKEQSRGSGPRYSLFLSLQNGLSTLIQALEKELWQRVSFHLFSSVTELRKKEEKWELSLKKGESFQADSVILALPAYLAAKALRSFHPDLASLLSSIPYASTAIVHLGYERKKIGHKLNGFGFVIPQVEKRKLLACSFSSVKFSGRAPAGKALLRCFLGGELQPEILNCSDQELLSLCHRELREILEIRGEPLFTHIVRHPFSMPQYHLGHLERLSHIQEMLAPLPSLALAGNAYNGIGIPDCICSAQQAAEKVLAHL